MSALRWAARCMTSWRSAETSGLLEMYLVRSSTAVRMAPPKAAKAAIQQIRSSPAVNAACRASV